MSHALLETLENLIVDGRQMVWTAKKPTKPGWYWWRSKPKKSPFVFNVYLMSNVWCCSCHNGKACSVNSAGGEWSSEPIPEPKEA
jgi:hypothetical protein